MNNSEPTFEHLKTTLMDDNQNDNSNESHVAIENAFNELIKQNIELNTRIKVVKNEVSKLRKKFADEFDKNLTFNILFISINQLVDEYDTQTKTFETYCKIYNDIFNEENVVKILDILRNILIDRKNVL